MSDTSIAQNSGFSMLPNWAVDDDRLGGYDLLVLVEGKSMREIARFVAEKLSTLEGVLSTSTHFHLKTYKKNGCVFEAPVQTERLAVAP